MNSSRALTKCLLNGLTPDSVVALVVVVLLGLAPGTGPEIKEDE